MIARPTLQETMRFGGPTPFGPGLAYGKGSPIGMSQAPPSIPEDPWAWWKPEYLDANYDQGETVTVWEDASGNERDLGDGINGTPSKLDNQVNGHGVVMFNSTEYFNNAKATTSTEITLFSVLFTAAQDSDQSWYGIGNADGSGAQRGMGILVRDWNEALNVGINEGTPIRCLDGTLALATAYAIVARHKTDLTELWVNGVLTEITNQTENFLACLGTDYLFMGSGGAHGNGFVAEAGIYAKAITDDEITTLNSYLTGKFAL